MCVCGYGVSFRRWDFPVTSSSIPELPALPGSTPIPAPKGGPGSSKGPVVGLPSPTGPAPTKFGGVTPGDLPLPAPSAASHPTDLSSPSALLQRRKQGSATAPSASSIGLVGTRVLMCVFTLRYSVFVNFLCWLYVRWETKASFFLAGALTTVAPSQPAAASAGTASSVTNAFAAFGAKRSVLSPLALPSTAAVSTAAGGAAPPSVLAPAAAPASAPVLSVKSAPVAALRANPEPAEV